MDRGAWKATVHKAAKSQARLNTHAQVSKSKLDKILKSLSHAIKVNYTKKKKRERLRTQNVAIQPCMEQLEWLLLTWPGLGPRKELPPAGDTQLKKKGGGMVWDLMEVFLPQYFFFLNNTSGKFIF